LIVEDEEAILQLLSEVFSVLDESTVLFSRDGEDALKSARINTPDVILLDVQIPRLKGYQVYQLIKTDPATAHARVIMLSGMAQHEDRQLALSARADALSPNLLTPPL